jgi:dipeptide/tripeptide permease
LLSFLVTDSSNRTFPQWWEVFIQTGKIKLDSIHHFLYGDQHRAFLGQFICPYVGDVKDATTGVRDIFAFKWGFLAASIAMIIGTVTFFILKNKYVVTPEGRPIGGLPKITVLQILKKENLRQRNSQEHL